MRVIVAALIGGIVMFVWGALSHMVLGIGDKGMHVGTPYEATLTALKQEAREPGIYFLPSTPMEQMADEAAQKALYDRKLGYAWIVYHPDGNPGVLDMNANLGKQFATDVLSAWICAFVLALVAGGFGRRVAVAALMGVFAWLVVSATYWNWYLFPADYTLGLLAKFAIGWTLAGAAIAWWLGRGERRA